MARIRSIKPGFFENEELAQLPPLARLLFAGLWCWADRLGRMEYRPARLKVQILPYDECNIEDLFDALENSGFIVRYAVENRNFLQVCNFGKHQFPHVKEPASTIPDPVKTEQEPGEPSSSPVQEPGGNGFSRPVTWDPVLGNGSLVNGSLVNGKDSTNPFRQPTVDRSNDIRTVFSHYKKHHKSWCNNANSKTKEWKLVKARLEEGFTVDEICSAIDGCHKTPFNLGENDQKTKYLGLELIVRNASNVTRFIENNSASQDTLSQKSAN